MSDLRHPDLRTSALNDHPFTPLDVKEVVNTFFSFSFPKDETELLERATVDIEESRLMDSPVRPLREMVTKSVDRVRYS
jgi:hypothetical protein